MNELLPLMFGLGAALCWGLYDYLSAKLAKKIGYQRAFFENAFSVTIIVAIVLTLANSFNFPSTQDAWAVGAVIGVLSFVGSLLLYKSFEIGKVSINSPIGGLYIVIAVLVVAVITKSTMPAVKIALGTLAVLFSALAGFHTFNLKQYKLEKGVLLALIATILFTATSTLPAVVKNQFNELTFAWLVMAITAISLTAINWKNAVHWAKNISLAGTFVGLLYFAGWVFYFFGINTVNSTIAVAITGLFPAVPVLLATTRGEEKLKTHQKISLAAMLILLAAFLLY